MSAITIIALSLSAKSINNKNSECKKKAPAKQNVEQTIAAITTVNNREELGVKTAPAAPNLKTSHGYMSASALLWNILTDASDVAYYTQTDSSSSPTTQSDTYQTNNWGWNWGVKASLGYRCNNDEWDLSLNFAYLQSTKRYSSALTLGTVGSYFNTVYPLSGLMSSLSTESDAPTWNSFSQTSRFTFYDGSIDLAREFYVSKQLSLKPLAGVKGTYFKQTAALSFSNIYGPGSFSNKNDFWGVGPQLGSGLRFGFTKHFSLDAQFDGALLWGKVLNTESCSYLTALATPTLETSQGTRYQLVPNINIAAGFLFDSNFSNNTKNIAFNIGYENRYFFNNIASTNRASRQQGSTSVQGVLAGLTFSY